MSDIIQLLPDSVANQIAAGEVVQRPASVVKELVENAIDSGSSDIKIVIKDAGRTLVQIIDNGCGMSETDARMAFERHATSKIREAHDLFAIRTMGFRGEALASIAAVAQVELKTRRHEDELGTHLVIAGSRVEIQEPVACPAGCNFMVKNLFFNVPARRRFLKTNATELRHIVTEFQRVALTNPRISFSLEHNGQTLFTLPQANLMQRVTALFGKHINQQLIPVEADTTLVKISGWAGKPRAARKGSADQYFFVNNRFMRHPYLHKAVLVAYENLISPEHYPAYFIFFEVKPEIIDINIHPTKTEIKFEDESSMWKILNASVREALGKFNLVPSIDFDQSGSIHIPAIQPGESPHEPAVEVDGHYNPFDDSGRPPMPPARDNAGTPAGWESLYRGFESTPEGGIDAEMTDEMIIPSRHDDERLQGDLGFNRNAEHQSGPGNPYFQIKNRYILTSVKSGLMIIDQRRAHQRILFDEFMASLSRGAALSQHSLFPEKLTFGAGDAMLLREIKQELLHFGFAIDEAEEENAFLIKGLPSVFKNVDVKELIDSLLDAFRNEEVDIERQTNEKMAMVMSRGACMNHPQALTQAEMASLIKRLFLTPEPSFTPMGKTVFTILENDELEKRFK